MTFGSSESGSARGKMRKRLEERHIMTLEARESTDDEIREELRRWSCKESYGSAGRDDDQVLQKAQALEEQ